MAQTQTQLIHDPLNFALTTITTNIQKQERDASWFFTKPEVYSLYTGDFEQNTQLENWKHREAVKNSIIYKIIDRIQEFKDLEDGWADEDSVAPSETTIHDAIAFTALLPDNIPEPIISAADDGEIVIEWAKGNKKAVVGFEGDGYFGYTLFKNGKFKPGAEEGCLENGSLPSDLVEYLEKN